MTAQCTYTLQMANIETMYRREFGSAAAVDAVSQEIN